MDTIMFDLDGTLLPVGQKAFLDAYFSALSRRLAPLGLSPELTVSSVWKGTRAMVKNDGSVSNFRLFWDGFAQSAGLSPERTQEIQAVTDDFYAREFDGIKDTLKVNCDRRPVIDLLKSKGYRLILATNPLFPLVAVRTRLRWLGLDDGDFKLVSTYENTHYCKPNPMYYREIMDTLSLVPEQCLMVGNSGKEDGCAADVGSAVYLITDFPEECDGVDTSRFLTGSFSDFEAFAAALPDIV